jgi:hypothetical protein
VHDSFRALVIKDSSEITENGCSIPPPLLNRFEKQYLSYKDLLNAHQRELLALLKNWMSSVVQQGFNLRDAFVGYHEDNLCAMIIQETKGEFCVDQEVIDEIKKNLLWTATPEMVVGLEKANLAKEEISYLQDTYFNKQIHSNLKRFIEEKPLPKKNFAIFTYSQSTVELDKMFGFNTKILKLHEFLRELDFTYEVKQFANSQTYNALVIQCHLHQLTSQRIRHAKYIVEKELKASNASIYFVIHTITRSNFSLAYDPNWQQILISELEDAKTLKIPETKDILNNTLMQLMQKKEIDIKAWLLKNYRFVISRLNYPSQNEKIMDRITLVGSLLEDDQFMEVLLSKVIFYIGRQGI